MVLKKLKREQIEWIVLIVLGFGLYFSGLYKEAAGMVQRIVLAPGLLTPDLIDESEQLNADYNFQLIDENGRKLGFDEFRGKTVFLNLWATWCPPCIAEMPNINDLYAKVDKEKIAFVMISRDKIFDTAIDFSKKKEYQFPIYSQVSRLPQVFQSNSIPTTFVISPQGKIVAKRVGMAKYDSEEFLTFINSL